MSHDIGKFGSRTIVTDERELVDIANQTIELMVSHNLRLYEVERTLEIIKETIEFQFIRNYE